MIGKMIVCDLFHFQDGRTVFVGPVKGFNGLIQKCQAEVLVNEKVYQIIELEGECLPDVKHPAGHRAVSTSSKIDLTADVVCIDRIFKKMLLVRRRTKVLTKNHFDREQSSEHDG